LSSFGLLLVQSNELQDNKHRGGEVLRDLFVCSQNNLDDSSSVFEGVFIDMRLFQAISEG
jgi:hypothetical protein